MQTEETYLEKNKALWNERTEHHVGSAFYNVDGFKQGKSSLNDIELKLLGDVKNKKILHLQCHFGQDSLSLARMGATVTGVDFSDKAVAEARSLAEALELDTRFVCCDLYSLPDYLNEEFDIVFTSYGTIGWLPDLDKWAAIVKRYMKQEGKFVFAEFHPVIWMYDNEFKKVQYSYFKEDAIVELEIGTYADTSADIRRESITWNHGLGEVMTALLKQGLTITSFDEYNYSPYNIFPESEEIEAGRFCIKALGNKAPLVYSLSAER